MLYHHHQKEEKVDRPLSDPTVLSRLPSVGIISEGTEASLEDTAEVFSRDSWNIVSPYPLPPHLEEPLCHEITEYVFPKAALSKQNEWR